MPSDYNPTFAQKICDAIRNNTYHNLHRNDFNINKIDSAAYVSDSKINFQGYISPLHYAALNGKFQIVENLINKGASPKKIVQQQCLTSILWLYNKPNLLNLLNYFFNDQNDRSEEDINKIRTKITA